MLLLPLHYSLVVLMELPYQYSVAEGLFFGTYRTAIRYGRGDPSVERGSEYRGSCVAAPVRLPA